MKPILRLFFLLLAFILIAVMSWGQGAAYVKVTAAVLEMLGQQGDWYVVKVPAGEAAEGQTGYILKILVQLIGGPPAQPVPQQPAAPTAIPPVVRETGLPPGGSLLKGFSLKFGWLASPSGQSIGDTWIASLGYDFALGRNFAIGLELQPSYHSFSDTRFEMKVIPIMAWAQLKGGINLGQVLKFLSFADAYAGVGVGGEADIMSATVDGQSASQTNFNFGMKAVLGLAFHLGTIRLLLEYQFAKVNYPDVDPNPWRGFILAGIGF